MQKNCKGDFVTINNELFYKTENYDCMDDFFMTITSSSDIWNFCWSKGGITAGRKNCDNAIFPYYTADKVSDAKSYTGPYTLIKINKNNSTYYWEPFSCFSNSTLTSSNTLKNNTFNLYKNISGSCIWFEEINNDLNLSFKYCYTSSKKFGLVRKVEITNLSTDKISLKILDGCNNILPPCCSADFQNNNSVLLDAYKKTDLIEDINLSLFSLSAVVSDKAEPSEALYANTCWFSTDDKVYLDKDCLSAFINSSIDEVYTTTLKGKRSSCFILHDCELSEQNKLDSWYQVFDISLNNSKIESLKKIIKNKGNAKQLLEKDISDTEKKLLSYISDADGIQDTALQNNNTHHFANVMFNVMRGGVIANNGNIKINDFIDFIKTRNKQVFEEVKDFILAKTNNVFISYQKLYLIITEKNNEQLKRLFFEYIPLTFSRRHGDPSRPWNRFNIELQDSQENEILNYEGNWRDIFQNWEALAYSYPIYTKNMCFKFLNAMTIEGFNPYRISRKGIEWEIPEIGNPWSNIGYWGDHQVIYLEKLLEVFASFEKNELLLFLNEEMFTSTNVPFKIKSFEEILTNPRNTIVFDLERSDRLIQLTSVIGTDARLVLDKNQKPFLVSLTAKLIQVIIAKVSNLIPGGGIWLNMQRPEWNDANNAVAGYGLSMVTVCYLRRLISFLISLYRESTIESFNLPEEIAICFNNLTELISDYNKENNLGDDKKRYSFSLSAGKIFETEHNTLYQNGYSDKQEKIDKNKLLEQLQQINLLLENTIEYNKIDSSSDNSLYHSYNTLIISANEMKISHLQEMLEGQVAVLSSGMLSSKQVLGVLQTLRNGKMFENKQYSYILYPIKELPFFTDKNCIEKKDIVRLTDFINKSKNKILQEDCNGIYHFNSDFRNIRLMNESIKTLEPSEAPSKQELKELQDLYEKTFVHQNFTGRSGSFYAYEGIGSIYWHMVSKLLLAAQENIFLSLNESKTQNNDQTITKELVKCYYDIQRGLGYNKTPKEYGAFPFDPYSHTPYGQGAKQPGMTGQVKEEIITRFKELGISIIDGQLSFNPMFLRKEEFYKDNTLSFTFCGVKIIYHLAKENKLCLTINDSVTTKNELILSKDESKKIFSRNKEITEINVYITSVDCLLA